MDDPILNQYDCLSLLHSPMAQWEESQRPWSHVCPLDQPLLRIWDRYSGSKPDHFNRMLSRNPLQPLYTRRMRRRALAIHADHKIWERTPFISFTTDRFAVEDLANMRIVKQRGPQYLTVVNPRIRAAKRLPLLDMAKEMTYYEVSNPYGGAGYYRNHFICLWEVTGEEVVGTWAWEDLCKDTDWYESVILLQYELHKQKALGNTEDQGSLDLGELGVALQSVDEYIERETPSGDDWSSGSERESWYEGSDWDTDDEAEEANATDDMLRILEGDWS